MKGLKEYLKKHGNHFTEQLAYDAALNRRWNKKQIENSIRNRVWYNVTDSSIGDIIYLFVKPKKSTHHETKIIIYVQKYHV